MILFADKSKPFPIFSQAPPPTTWEPPLGGSLAHPLVLQSRLRTKSIPHRRAGGISRRGSEATQSLPLTGEVACEARRRGRSAPKISTAILSIEFIKGISHSTYRQMLDQIFRQHLIHHFASKIVPLPPLGKVNSPLSPPHGGAPP